MMDSLRRPMRRARTAAAVAMSLTVVLSAAACGGDDEAAAGEPKRLVAALSPSTQLAPFFIAKEYGYFQEEGLEVDIQPIAASQDALVLLSQGKYDVTNSGISAGLLNSIAAGLDIRMVAPLGKVADPPGSGLYVRKELVDNGTVKGFDGILGLRTSTPGTVGGTSTTWLFDLYAKKAGGIYKDFKYQSLDYPSAVIALEQGTVDLAYLTSPFVGEVEQSGVAVPVGGSGGPKAVYGKEVQIAVLFGPNLLVKDREAGSAMLRALAKAATHLQGDYRKDPKVVAAIVKHLKVKEQDVLSSPPNVFDPALATSDRDKESLVMAEEFFRGSGFTDYKDKLSVDKLMDLDFK